MARTVTLPPKTWTQITTSNATKIVFQNQNEGASPLFVKATVGEVAPTSIDGSWMYLGTKGELLVIADWFPDVSGANRVYVYSETGGRVAVAHAA